MEAPARLNWFWHNLGRSQKRTQTKQIINWLQLAVEYIIIEAQYLTLVQVHVVQYKRYSTRHANFSYRTLFVTLVHQQQGNITQATGIERAVINKGKTC